MLAQHRGCEDPTMIYLGSKAILIDKHTATITHTRAREERGQAHTGQRDRVSPGRCAECRCRHCGRLQAGHARHHKPGRHAGHDTARRRLIKACEQGCAAI